jgi:putative membrane protein
MRNLLIVAGFSLMASSALAQTAPQEFVDKAAAGGMYEIQSSEMVASDAGANADVQAFAQQMIADHTKAAADLKAAAGKSSLTVPAALDAKHQAMITELSASSDKVPVYLKQQLAAHEEAVALHEGYASAGTDANLKAYAVAVTPTLKMHLEHVRMLNGDGTAATGSTDTTGAGSSATTAAPAN